MIYWIYEQMLRRQIKILPGHVCFMISGKDLADAPDRLLLVTRWCTDLTLEIPKNRAGGGDGIKSLTFHISTPLPEQMERCLPAIRAVGTAACLHLHYRDEEEVLGTGLPVVVAIGKSGREEITSCIRRMAMDGIATSAVDEHLLESYLTFQYSPDIVVKSGGDHLTDFLIWQSVYSEIFFSDINWRYFRKVDFLRILRDYQSRVRRFGT